MIADGEFRVWAIRQCADMIRGMDTVREAVEYLESIADHLDIVYDELGRPIPEQEGETR